MFAGYIFDVEGTLVDSVSCNLRSFQESLEQMGYVVPFETLQLYSGLDGDQAIQILIPALDEGARKQVLDLKSKIFREKYLDIVKPFPWGPQCIQIAVGDRRKNRVGYGL